MLDLLLPVPIDNIDLVTRCLDRFDQLTDVPFNISIIIDGGNRNSKEIVNVEAYLNGMARQWTLLHNKQPEYLNKCLADVIATTSQLLVAFAEPHVVLDDPKWFGKVQQIFHRDPACAIVDTAPDTKSSTLYPIKRAHNRPPLAGCPLAVLQGRFIRATLPTGNVDPCEFWFREALRCGGSGWCAPGVRYFEMPHKPYLLWKEPSAELASPSGSPSPATPDSSSPMTTATDGSKVGKQPVVK